MDDWKVIAGQNSRIQRKTKSMIRDEFWPDNDSVVFDFWSPITGRSKDLRETRPVIGDQSKTKKTVPRTFHSSRYARLRHRRW